MNADYAAGRILSILKSDTTQTYLTNATVTSESPLAIRIDGETIDTPEEGLIVAEHLTNHERTWRLKGSDTYQTFEIRSNLKNGNRVIVAVTNDEQLVFVLDKAVE